MPSARCIEEKPKDRGHHLSYRKFPSILVWQHLGAPWLLLAGHPGSPPPGKAILPNPGCAVLGDFADWRLLGEGGGGLWPEPGGQGLSPGEKATPVPPGYQ